MIKKPVTIQTDMSTEDRSVALLVQEASQYQSQVFFEVEEKKINAKSIMGMMTLRLCQGEELTVGAEGIDDIAEGKDEEEAAKGLELFLSDKK